MFTLALALELTSFLAWIVALHELFTVSSFHVKTTTMHWNWDIYDDGDNDDDDDDNDDSNVLLAAVASVGLEAKTIASPIFATAYVCGNWQCTGNVETKI